MNADTHGVQKKVLDPLKLKFKMTVSHLTWTKGTELRFRSQNS